MQSEEGDGIDDFNTAKEKKTQRRRAEVEPEVEPNICWVCQFPDCEDKPDEPLLLSGCACCREGSSAGWVHVSCVVGVAQHQPLLWLTCPTCQQDFTGELLLQLNLARAEREDDRPEADPERLLALNNRAAQLVSSGDFLGARPLLEELVAVLRRTCGEGHPETLEACGRLGDLLRHHTGDLVMAQRLLEHAAAGLRRARGAEHEQTLNAAISLALLYNQIGAFAKSRMLHEKAIAVMRRTQPSSLNLHLAMDGFGLCLAGIGDHVTGLALRDSAVEFARRLLGDAHPTTLDLVKNSSHMRRELMAKTPPGVCGNGTLIGLQSKPELNGKESWVVGFDATKGRYHVRVAGSMLRDKPLAIKLANLILKQGSAVIVDGLTAAPEWNGKRGLVESYDPASGRHRLLMSGREKALGVRLRYCKLESVVEPEPEPAPEE